MTYVIFNCNLIPLILLGTHKDIPILSYQNLHHDPDDTGDIAGQCQRGISEEHGTDGQVHESEIEIIIRVYSYLF